MSTRRIAACALVIMGVLVMAGCSPTENDTRVATAGLPDLAQSLMAHDWVLDPSRSSIGIPDGGEPVTLRFSDDFASGTASCNTYRAAYTVDDDDESISFSDIATTRRACAPRVMEFEDSYLAALQAVDTVDATKLDELELTGPDDVRLVYDAFDVREELTGQWEIVNVTTGDAITSVVVGTTPVLTLEEDGRLTAETGCNNLSGTWSLDDDERLTVSELSQTMMGCLEPAGVAEQETAIAGALQAANQVELTPNRSLTLLDRNGRTVLIAVKS